MARQDGSSFVSNEGMYMSNGMRGAVVASLAAMVTMVGWTDYVEAQNRGGNGGGTAVGVADRLAAPIAPLGLITVPDVNALGILDLQGNPGVPGADAWEPLFGGPITNTEQRGALVALGKALFWDMQVGGDGIQACATCHYHAGADNRITNQMSPGIKMTVGGPDVPAGNEDREQDLLAANGKLEPAHFSALNQNGEPVGLPVSETALLAAGSQPDGVQGDSGVPGAKPDAAADVNDVVSSQGVRLGTYGNLSGGPVDAATLSQYDPGFDQADPHTAVYSNDTDAGPVHTFRRVEPRNSPTAVNAVYHMRNFWDGRADMFFNGVTPLGFRDPDSAVKVYIGGSLSDQTLRIPFSSLASQAVGPIESDFEMVFAGRPHRDLGKKLLAPGVVPLAGQAVSTADSVLGIYTNGSGLTKSYTTFIQEIFDERFWGDGAGNDVCLDLSGGDVACTVDDGLGGSMVNPAAAYTLMEWNFSMFFGLAVQAYEATLTTEQTIVDLLVGGVATGIVTNSAVGARNTTTRSVDVGPPAPGLPGLPLEGCIVSVALSNNAVDQAVATELCIRHYAQFIHPGAVTGSESAVATANAVPAGTAIGGCASGNPVNTTTTLPRRGVRTWTAPCGTGGALAGTVPNILASVQAMDRGLGRFFAGATGCAICHFNPEFTGATVAALTGFGAAPPPPLPPGQARRVPLEVPMERMIAFNGAPAVYDAGFYNLGVRPTPEDISLGAEIGGVPLAFSKLAELLGSGLNAITDPGGNYNAEKIAKIGAELDPATGILWIPTGLDPVTGVFTLAPRRWQLALACGPGLVGGGNANNNPTQNCVPNVIQGERLLRNGAFKAQGLRNVKFTGPYLHNGSKMNLSEVVNFYETAGHFPVLNFNNLDAGLRIFNLGPADTAALTEMMETGLTDWRLAYEEGKFDHPQICVPHGHDTGGTTILREIPAVGAGGHAAPLTTFEDILNGRTGTHDLLTPCTMTPPGDTPPAPAP